MTWLQAIERTVTGLGYELVDCTRTAGGLLTVFIDRVDGAVYATGPGESVTVDDCEVVTRQLQYALEVEACDYARLEVSSPGLDRPLRRPADFVRFAGSMVDLTLKRPFQGRKKYQGLLRVGPEEQVQADDSPGGFELIFRDGGEDKVLGFVLDEVRDARLVPVVDFKKGRKRAEIVPVGLEGAGAGEGAGVAPAAKESGGHEE